MTTVTYVYDLGDYLRVLRQRRSTILGTTTLVVVSTLAFTFLSSSDASAPADPPTQETTPSSPRAIVAVMLDPLPVLEEETNPARERISALSTDVLASAARELPGLPDASLIAEAVEVVTVPEAGALLFSSEGIGETGGNEVAEAVASSYLKHRRARLQEAIANAEASIVRQIRETRSADDSTFSSIRIATLLGELSALRTSASSTGGEIVSSSVPPSELFLQPSPPPTLATTGSEPSEDAPVIRNGVAGLVLGLVLGFALALALDVIDPRFRSVREVKGLLRVPVLAEVPATISHGRSEQIREAAVQIESMIAGESPRTVTLLGLGEAAQRSLGETQKSLGETTRSVEIVGSSSLATAATASSVVVVLSKSTTKREEARRALEVLERSGVRTLGTVILN